MIAMPLDDHELERYARHMLLKEVGGPGQEALKRARVLVVGAGGLGAPVLMYLAAAGVGTLGVIDDDIVSLSNLQRQIIHATARVGEPKTASALPALFDINPHVKVEPHQMRLELPPTPWRSSRLRPGGRRLGQFRHPVPGQRCLLSGRKTLVWAAVGQFDGQVSTFKPHLSQADGTPYPTYRCLNPESPPPGLVPSCEEAGILGALTGIIGSIQALEAIKEIVGVGDSLAGRLLLYDALAARMFAAKLAWDPDQPRSTAATPNHPRLEPSRVSTGREPS
jgi:molybdopterin-synthase adenylyltransferase